MSKFETADKVRAAVAEIFPLLDARFDLGAAVLTRRPDYQGAWTVAEHLEHVFLANHFLLLTIRKGCRIAIRRAVGREFPEGESDLDLLAPVAVPGAFDWQPPVHMIPTGGMPLEELRDGLRGQREECLELTAAMPAGEGRLYSIRMSVNRLGRLDMYQWLYFLLQHARYHLALIARLTAS